MNLKKIKSILLTLSLFAMLTVAVPAKTPVAGSGGINAAPPPAPVTIVGSWEIDGLTSPNGPQNGAAFKALGTFIRDGGFTNSASADPSLMATPGYGAWEKIKGHQYAFAFKQILGGADGSFQGLIKVKGDLSLNSHGDEFDGTFYIEISDANGGVVLTDTGIIKGKRIQVED